MSYRQEPSRWTMLMVALIMLLLGHLIYLVCGG